MAHGVAVSAVVAELAALVAEHRAPLTETESAIAGLVADMPRFMAEGRGLDTWEFELGNAHRRQRNAVGGSAEPGSTWALLRSIEELGGWNLYGAFHSASTQQQYRRVAAELSEALGVEVEIIGEIDRW